MADFYVSTTGLSSNAGTIGSPWSLDHALSHPAGVAPGDTIWLREGTYNGSHSPSLTGTSALPIKVRNYNNERVTLNNPSDYDTITGYSSYTWYWGLELTSNGVKRKTASWQSAPGDGFLDRGIAFKNFGTGNRVINCIIHDNQQGVGSWGFNNSFPNLEVYGNLIYYNGAEQTATGRLGWGIGHGTYLSSYINGHTTLKDNIIHSNANTGIRLDVNVYSPDIQGNISFNNGDMYANGGRNIFVNPDNAGGTVMSGLIARNNYTYHGPQRQAGTIGNIGGSENAHFGMWGKDGSFSQGGSGEIKDNYFAGPFPSGALTADQIGAPLILGYWDHFDAQTSTGNIIAGPNVRSYVSTEVPTASNTYTTTRPATNAIFVRPNTYETGRAHVAVYNWQLASTVSVPLSGTGLVNGQAYEIRDAMNYYGPAVASGTYSTGGSATVPMTGLTRAMMEAEFDISSAYRPVHPTPEFGAFVVIPTASAPPQEPEVTEVEIVLDRVVDGGQTTSSATHTYSHTCAGGNRIIFIFSFGPTTDLVTGCTVGGNAATLIRKQTITGRWCYLWYYIAPAVGANTIVITASQSVSVINAKSVSYKGAHQTTPIIASNENIDTNGVLTLTSTINTTHDGAWTLLFARAWDDIVAGVGSVLRTVGTIGISIFDSDGPISPVADRSMTITQTLTGGGVDETIGAFMVALRPVQAPAPLPPGVTPPTTTFNDHVIALLTELKTDVDEIIAQFPIRTTRVG